MHIFNDERMIIGQCIIELGLIETMALRLSRAQEQDDISDLPPNIGSFLYRLIVDSDNVSLETLSTDNFNVSLFFHRLSYSLYYQNFNSKRSLEFR